MRRDIVITWPQTRTLESYLDACARAKDAGEVINYRVRNPPEVDFGAWADRRGRVYVVHGGFVRGYNDWLYTTYRETGEVLDPVTGGFWPPGVYLVRDPAWHPIEPVPMRGFRGWRYFDTDTTEAAA